MRQRPSTETTTQYFGRGYGTTIEHKMAIESQMDRNVDRQGSTAPRRATGAYVVVKDEVVLY